jgi:hypothetical protein
MSFGSVGQASLIRTDSQTIGSSLGSLKVADLTLAGRSIDSLLATAPGVETTGAAFRPITRGDGER